MNGVLLATHFAFFFAAMGVCRVVRGLDQSVVAWVLGVLGLPIFGLVTLALLDFSDHASNGTTGAWYLIFTVLTLGGLPLVTHLSAAVSGVCVARVVRWFRERDRGLPAPQ